MPVFPPSIAADQRDQARIAALAYLHAVRPDADAVLQQLVDDVRGIFGTDLCMINLVTADMQYFRAWSGDLPAELVVAGHDPRERSMCQYVVDTEQPLVVPNFRASATFHDQYFCVTYGIQFYAGTPLVTSDGQTIGSLCLLHTAPLVFGDDQLVILAAFARAVVGRIEVLGALARERVEHQAKEAVFTALQVATQQDAVRIATELQRTRDISLDIITIIGFDGVIRTINPACQTILGYAPDELVGCSVTDLVHPDDVLTTVHMVGTAVQNFENRYLHKDGNVVWLEWNARPVAEEQVMYCVARDRTARKAVEAQLHHQAFHDPLTGLPNRALFVERLEHVLQRGTRQDRTSAVVLLDLDRFKVINDSLGHVVGDQLLQAAAARLTHCVRPHDTVARFGGDEFTLLLEDIADVHAAVQVAERIAEALAAPFSVGGYEVIVTASLGIALVTTSHDRPNDLLRAADLALYGAKHRGRARYHVFEPRMQVAALARLQGEADLRRALERDELLLYYQPKVALATHTLVGMEALVRWQHPTHGLVAPTTFIPLAEETGLILPLGRWVLAMACRQARRWQAQYPTVPLIMSVNLSARQFQDPALIEDIVAVLRDTGMASNQIQLEITESVVMDDVEATIGTLHRLKALGVQVAIDDFGTGYSSLSYLKHFPIDTLKIDKAFVDGLGRTPHDTAIVEAISMLAHALGLSVTAEGVETATQAAQVQQLGCELGQGYYWAPPLPCAAAAGWVARAAADAHT